MTDLSTDIEYHEYKPTVPKAYIALAWLWVAVPFGYGVWQLLLKVGPLFGRGYWASRLTSPLKTLGSACAAGTMPERSDPCVLAASRAAVSPR
jgi:hypothetical protein